MNRHIEVKHLVRGATIAGILLASFAPCEPPKISSPSPVGSRPPATEPAPNFAIPTPTAGQGLFPQETPISENELLIQQEITRLGIGLNDDERLLWQTFGYKFDKDYAQKFTTPEAKRQEAENRIEGVLTLMFNSKNIYLKQASDDYAWFLNQEKVNYYINISNEGFKQKTSIMETNSAIFTDGKLGAYITMSAAEILETQADIIIAIQLAHEIEHVRNIINYYNTLPDHYSIEEKLAKQQERQNNREEFIAEEARGYATEARAYIEAYAQGYRGGKNTIYEKRAVEFIKAGGKEDSSEWLRFIEKHLKELGMLE